MRRKKTITHRFRRFCQRARRRQQQGDACRCFCQTRHSAKHPLNSLGGVACVHNRRGVGCHAPFAHSRFFHCYGATCQAESSAQQYKARENARHKFDIRAGVDCGGM